MTVLVALLNALILFAAVGGIIFEAVFRFYNPQPLQGKLMATVVAFIGIIINALDCLFFMKDKDKDLIKGAYFTWLQMLW